MPGRRCPRFANAEVHTTDVDAVLRNRPCEGRTGSPWRGPPCDGPIRAVGGTAMRRDRSDIGSATATTTCIESARARIGCLPGPLTPSHFMIAEMRTGRSSHEFNRGHLQSMRRRTCPHRQSCFSRFAGNGLSGRAPRRNEANNYGRCYNETPSHHSLACMSPIRVPCSLRPSPCSLPTLFPALRIAAGAPRHDNRLGATGAPEEEYVAIHPTAIVHPQAELDPSVEVGPFCVIEEHVRVAAGCRLYQGVYLTGWTEIGEGCTLHPGAIVGHAPQDYKYKGERSYVRIGRGTTLREYCTVHRGTMPDSVTAIGEACMLLAGAHVAHNCVLGQRVTMMNNALLAGHVEVSDRATISGGVVVHQFVRIGELAMIAGNARVPMDVAPYALVDVEGRIAGLNRVGLRRAELSREEIRDVQEAYRAIFRGGSFRDGVAAAAQQVRTDAGRRLVAFLQADSRRGYAGRARRGGGGDEAGA